MPARSRAEWRLLFARNGEKRGKQLAEGTGSKKVTYKSLPERVSK